MASSDGYQVDPTAVDRVAGDITALGTPLESQGAPWSAAVAAITTGDATLDAETRQVAEWIEQVLHALARRARDLGQKMETVSAGYRAADQQVAAGYRLLETRGGTALPPSQPGVPSV